MIKLIAPLLAFTALLGGENFFLLPDHNSAFLYRLNNALRNSSDQVLIITPSFGHSPLKKALLQGAKNGSKITLISSQLTSSARALVQYNNVQLYHYISRPLIGSLIIIDNKLVCTLTVPLVQEELENVTSFAQCSDTPHEIIAARDSILPMIKRAKPYLED